MLTVKFHESMLTVLCINIVCWSDTPCLVSCTNPLLEFMEVPDMAQEGWATDFYCGRPTDIIGINFSTATRFCSTANKEEGEGCTTPPAKLSLKPISSPFGNTATIFFGQMASSAANSFDCAEVCFTTCPKCWRFSWRNYFASRLLGKGARAICIGVSPSELALLLGAFSLEFFCLLSLSCSKPVSGASKALLSSSSFVLCSSVGTTAGTNASVSVVKVISYPFNPKT